MSTPAINTASPAETAVERGVRLLGVILLMLILAFCFFASSICITLLLASFLAILADPAVRALERLRIPRSIASAIVVLAGAAILAVFLYVAYLRVNALSDKFPLYAVRVQQFMRPINERIQRVQNSAGALVHDAAPNQAPELRIREATPWSTYLLRGVGSIGGAFVIAGAVPFLVYFMLIVHEKLYICFKTMLGNRVNLDLLIERSRSTLRGYVVGNLIVGAVLAVISVAVFWKVGLKPAITLGIVSGGLSLIPFIGVSLALAVPLIAGLVQFASGAQFVIVIVTVLLLHLVAANFLIPRYVGSHLDIGPVAATVGLLFWGWLWGIPGLLLAVPLTAVVKVLADANPSLAHLSNLLARNPRKLRKRNASKEAAVSEPKKKVA